MKNIVIGVLLALPDRARGDEPLVSGLAAARAVAIDEEALSAAVRGRAGADTRYAFSPALALADGGIVVAWSACDRVRCTGYAGVLRSTDGTRYVLQKQQALVSPKRVFAVDGIGLEAVALFDVDGDGRAELLVDYTVLEPPRPALGSIAHRYQGIFGLPLLAPVWHFEVRRSGAAVEPVCAWEVTRSTPQDSPGGVVLTAVGGCRPGAGSGAGGDAEAAPRRTERFRFSQAAQRFLPTVR